MKVITSKEKPKFMVGDVKAGETFKVVGKSNVYMAVQITEFDPVEYVNVETGKIDDDLFALSEAKLIDATLVEDYEEVLKDHEEALQTVRETKDNYKDMYNELDKHYTDKLKTCEEVEKKLNEIMKLVMELESNIGAESIVKATADALKILKGE